MHLHSRNHTSMLRIYTYLYLGTLLFFVSPADIYLTQLQLCGPKS